MEQIPADRPSAEVRLARAEEKLDAARRIAAIDTEIAYVTAYDAMRIAVTAHMLAAGYRVPGIAGGRPLEPTRHQLEPGIFLTVERAAAYGAPDCDGSSTPLPPPSGGSWLDRRPQPGGQLRVNGVKAARPDNLNYP